MGEGALESRFQIWLLIIMYYAETENGGLCRFSPPFTGPPTLSSSRVGVDGGMFPSLSVSFSKKLFRPKFSQFRNYCFPTLLLVTSPAAIRSRYRTSLLSVKKSSRIVFSGQNSYFLFFLPRHTHGDRICSFSSATCCSVLYLKRFSPTGKWRGEGPVSSWSHNWQCPLNKVLEHLVFIFMCFTFLMIFKVIFVLLWIPFLTPNVDSICLAERIPFLGRLAMYHLHFFFFPCSPWGSRNRHYVLCFRTKSDGRKSPFRFNSGRFYCVPYKELKSRQMFNSLLQHM